MKLFNIPKLSPLGMQTRWYIFCLARYKLIYYLYKFLFLCRLERESNLKIIEIMKNFSREGKSHKNYENNDIHTQSDFM
jgi:hypothetical protein